MASRADSVTLQQRWQYAGRRRIAKATWLRPYLPWGLWCRLCAWNAAQVVEEIARRSGRPLTFVQIGSCDGKTNDPLHDVVRSHQWSGVLVEPVPWLFEQLVSNYEGVPGLHFFQVAVGGGEGPMTMHSVDPRPGDPHWVAQLTSFDRDVVLSHAYALPDLESRIFAVEVTSRTVQSLIAEAGLSSGRRPPHRRRGIRRPHHSRSPIDGSVGTAVPDLREEAPECDPVHRPQETLAGGGLHGRESVAGRARLPAPPHGEG